MVNARGGPDMSEKPLRSICWDGDAVAILDQRLLPERIRVIRCTTTAQVVQAIKQMAIRGAPAAGIAGAMALALGARRIRAADATTFRRKFLDLCQQVKSARPTGNNLLWAVEKIHAVVVENTAVDRRELTNLIRQTADAILAEDVRVNQAIGAWGAKLVPPCARILTYCNTGSLATAGYGTALGIIRAAHTLDPKIHVYACETRPFLQGSRLTALELQQDRIPFTLITDNAAGYMMRRGKVDLLLVGADRIAANGDVANKIGTYTLAILAHTHNVPFYVAAPRSTIDPSLGDGDGIQIEQRDPKEITHLMGRALAPAGTAACNPAFDITPHQYITGIVTEVGILRKPFRRAIRKALQAREAC
jgi:methylthioribose-1-phosphate isomerase